MRLRTGQGEGVGDGFEGEEMRGKGGEELLGSVARQGRGAACSRSARLAEDRARGRGSGKDLKGRTCGGKERKIAGVSGMT